MLSLIRKKTDPTAAAAPDDALAMRRRLCAEIAALADDPQACALAEAYRAAQRATAAAQEALERTRLEERRAQVAWAEASSSAERVRRALQAELRDTASPEITALVRELRARREEMRGARPAIETFTDAAGQRHETRTSIAAREDRARLAEALFDALAELEALKLEALSPAELAARLADIRTRVASPALQIRE